MTKRGIDVTFTQRLQQARTAIAEIFEVVQIGMALQNREITAEQASEAISRVGIRRDDLELASH
jgi:hypothetical protein